MQKLLDGENLAWDVAVPGTTQQADTEMGWPANTTEIPMTEPEATQPQTDEPRAAQRPDHTIEENLAASLGVRAEDIEPYIGLRYLSRLFKVMAVILIILIVAEIITGLVAQGTAAIPTLLAEVSRLIVLAGLLWGTGDFAILIIDVGHDVRAARILLGRMAAHSRDQHGTGEHRGAHI